MQPTTVVVVADKTSLKRPFIFLNSLNMDRYGVSGLVQHTILGAGCLLLSVIGVCGACKEKRWYLILFAVGMAAASQTMIVKTALICKPLYEKEVVGREASFLSMMPLRKTSSANRTLLENVQASYKCCGLVEGYKDWGVSIPTSCLCEYSGRKCVRLRGNFAVGAQKNQLIYQEM
ncbi:tetraspanin-8-like [Polymixia lowei]